MKGSRKQFAAAKRFCETVIRERPEHRLGCYKRWKFRPPEEVGRFPDCSRYWPTT